MSNIIEISNLNFTYSKNTPFEKKALSNINLCIKEGEFVSLVGATGSGKSTLVQHLNGLIKIQNKKESSILIDGNSLVDKKKLRNIRFDVGMVFQYPEYQLFEDTVAKDIAFGPKNMKLSNEEIDNRVKEAMTVVGLDYESFKDRSPFDLSGGEKRRVAIAGVIAMRPKVLVLDEPVAGLDPIGKEEILSLIKKLQKEVSPTIILVSHNMDDVANLSDRVIGLKSGEVVLDATPKKAFSDRELIKDIGLDIPMASKLVDRLNLKGLMLPKDIITMTELKDALIKIREDMNV